jgi:hypothetical protein
LDLGNQQPSVLFTAVPQLVPVQMYAMPTADVEMQVFVPAVLAEHQPLIVL